MQGVSINIFVKNSKSNNAASDIYHYDLYGTRKSKYDLLSNTKLSDISWKKLSTKEPYWFFVPKDFNYQDSYEKGFEINGLPENSDKLKVIHAGTVEENDKIVTSGGRVLNIVGISSENDLTNSKSIAYEALTKVKYNNITYRRDIGHRALNK